MPIYEYECAACGRRYEVFVRTATGAENGVCPACGSPDFIFVPRFRIFLLIAAVFIGIGAVVNQTLLAATALIAVAAGVLLMPSARCRRCLNRWSPEPREDRIEAPPPNPSDMIEEACPRCGAVVVRGEDEEADKG